MTTAFISCSENKESEDLVGGNEDTLPKGYTIDCDFEGVDISKAYLSQYVKGNWEHKDSADVVEGKFSFSGELELPEVWYLRFDDKKAYVSLFVENSQVFRIFCDVGSLHIHRCIVYLTLFNNI